DRTSGAGYGPADIAASDAPLSPGLSALQSEVDVLRARVETLELLPGGSPELEQLRTQLAEAEARLAAGKQAEREAAQGATPDSDAVRDAMADPSQAEPGLSGPDPAQDRRTQGTPPVSDAVTDTPQQELAPVVDRRPNDGGTARNETWDTAVESAGDIAPDYDPDYDPAPDRPEGSGTPVDF
ncbi:MAG: hypothetical protein OXI10_12390, partial [Gammaproteobacteria bacterium]|nr:hypothetical protein [Gammaproteobacteria bacterium]